MIQSRNDDAGVSGMSNFKASMIFKARGLLSGLGASLLCAQASAQTAEPRLSFDVATIICRQFVELPTDVVRTGIIYWLDGYYRGSYQPTLIDTGMVETARVRLMDYCASNQAYPVISAYKRLFVVGRR
jgi:hypothetical protein